MVRSCKMYWVPSGKRWLKEYLGKQYAISCRQLRKLGLVVAADTKDGSASAANEWWDNKQAELEARLECPDLAFAIRTHERYEKWFQKHHPAPDEQSLADLVADRLKLFRDVKARGGSLADTGLPGGPTTLDPTYNREQGISLVAERFRWAGRFESTEIAGATPLTGDKSLTHHTTAYRKKAERDSRAGIIAPGRAQKVANSLGWIDKFFLAENLTTVEQVNSKLLDDFYAWLFLQVKDKQLSIYTARDHWQVCRVWIQWLAEGGTCALPMNINHKRFRFALPKVKYRYWTAEDFQNIYGTAGERLKLYLLLIANCGFYASDIGSLKKSELDLKAGTITRQRTKTGEHLDDGYEASGNVPVTTFFLWPETLAALKRHVSADHILALTNEDGGPLWQDGLRDDGRYFRTDNIVSAFKRHIAKVAVKKPNTLENIRKTSAQFLSDSDFRDCANTFGGWSPKGVREKHYTETSSERFAQALNFLRTQYGFTATPQKPIKAKTGRKSSRKPTSR